MEIRKAASQDVKRINDLLFQVAKIHADGRPDIFKAASKKYSDEELIKIIECEKTPVFVATEDGDVIGYAFCVFQITEGSLLLQDKKTLYIDDLCVDENKRGAHVGHALYDHVISFAKENGVDNITLNVWAFNDNAYKFYQKLGMKELKIVMEQNLNQT